MYPLLLNLKGKIMLAITQDVIEVIMLSTFVVSILLIADWLSH
jgi:hypothetical protein